MSENKTKAPATRQKESGWGSDNEHESEMMASAMPPLFGLAASPAQPNPGDKKSFEDDKEADTRGIVVAGIPPVAVAEIIKFEDLKFSVYNDSLGIPTAGIGHKLSEVEKKKFSVGAKVSKAQIEAWAKADMTSAWNASLGQCAKLEITQSAFQVALFSVNFQLGIYWNTKHVKTWGYMLEGDWENAALEAANSTWFKQTENRVVAFQEALRNLPPKGSKGASAKATENGTKSVGKSLAPKTAKPSAKSPSPKTAEPTGKDRVKAVQTKLKALGHYTGAIDGIEFRRDKKESNTTKGIKAFQKSKGLPVTGKVDPATWDALNGKSKPKTVSDWMKEKVAESKEAVKASEGKGWGSDREVGKGEGEKGWGSSNENASASPVGETGNFVDAKYWLTQQSASKGGQKGFVSPHASPTACRYVSTEMLIKYMKAEKPELLEELGVDGIGDLSFGTNVDVTENSAESGNFLRILQEDAAEQKGGYEKNVQKPNEMIVSDQAATAIAYIEEKLAMGVPLVVGVDHTFNRGRNEGTTDHFITLTGIGKTKEGKKFYHFFDPARSNQANGVDNGGKNVLEEEAPGRYRAPKATGSNDAQRYFLATVIVFPADRKRFKTEQK